MDEYEYELLNMSQEEMERIANEDDNSEDTTLRPGG